MEKRIQTEPDAGIYERQREKYGKSIEVLYDVSKHIRSIEELYQAGVTDKAMEYTKKKLVCESVLCCK